MEVYEDMISNIELQSNNIDIKDNNIINYMIEEGKESQSFSNNNEFN
jgi:hypothetical protein